MKPRLNKTYYLQHLCIYVVNGEVGVVFAAAIVILTISVINHQSKLNANLIIHLIPHLNPNINPETKPDPSRSWRCLVPCYPTLTHTWRGIVP